MNEELKIIIKAVTDEAKKNLAGVKEELEGIKQEGNTVDKAMKTVAKGVGIAVGAFTALTAAIVTLTKRSMEFQKSYAQLISGFQSSGSTVKQAAETYKNLFRFLGDSDTATEASNLLVKLTNDQKELAEWTTILQGVYATFPDSLPVEALAESANETARVGKVTGNLADALNWAGVSEDAMNAKLATTNSLEEREAILRGTLNNLYGGAATLYERNNKTMLEYNESQANLNTALANATRYVIPLMTQLNNMATTILQILKPAFETISAVIIVFVQWIVAAIEYIGTFFSLFSKDGANSTKAVNDNVSAVKENVSGLTSGVNGLSNSLDNAASAATALKKVTMGFDELNVVSSQTSSSSTGSDYASGDTGSSANIPTIDTSKLDVPGMSDFQDKVADIKEKMSAIAILVAAIGAGLLLWKIADFITEISAAKKIMKAAGDNAGYFYQQLFNEEASSYLDDLKTKFKNIGGTILVVAGAVLLVKGYLDAWVNGIDWGNFSLMLSGIALIVGGLALMFGTTGAAIGLLVGGIALLVVGIKDFVTNGYSMQNVLTILAGVVATAIGVILLFNAALLANPITWICIGIAALVAAFVILWNECEGFRNFWKAVWEKCKELFAAFLNSIQPLIDAVVGAFKEAWELIKVIWNDYLVPLFKATWEAIKTIWNGVKPFFEMVWNNIKIVFSVVKEVLSAYFSAAWEAIKIVWNQVVAYFTAIWNTIKGIFAVVKSVLKGDWQGAWDAIKGIVDTWKGYFQTTWDNIKAIFAVVGTFFKTAFKAAWDGIKAIFANVSTFFGKVWSQIKGCFSAVGSWFKGIFSGAWTLIKAVFDGVKTFFGGIWKRIQNCFSTVKTWFKGIFSGAWTNIKGVFDGVTTFFSGIWKKVQNCFSTVKNWFKGRFSGAWTNVKNAFSGVSAFFKGVWGSVKTAFSSVGTWFKTTFTTAWTNVKNVFSTGGKIFSGIKSGIESTFKTVVNKLIGGINTVVAVPFNAINGMLNKIRNTEIVGFKPFEKLWKQNPVSIPAIPKLATGGIVTSSILANIGEAGKEAVLPLENNTGWMDILADRIASRNNTPSRLVLMLDGKELGYATINSFNDIYKQTGNLPIVIA